MEIDVGPSEGGWTLVAVRGRIVDGEPAERLQARLRELVAAGDVRTAIDLSGVEWFDSTGVEILIGHYVSVNKRGGAVALLGAPPRIRRLLAMARLEGFFVWASDLDEARRKAEARRP